MGLVERLQRRVAYGGRKGRRAALRLRQRVREYDRTQWGCALFFSGVDWKAGKKTWVWLARAAGRRMPIGELVKLNNRVGREVIRKHLMRESDPSEWLVRYTNRDGSPRPNYWLAGWRSRPLSWD